MNNSYAQNPICIWYVIEIIPKLNEFPRALVQLRDYLKNAPTREYNFDPVGDLKKVVT